ncbi:MAG TPA: hypothetical protein VEX61_13115 [Burkholderiales bacterium]|nr:hypothetical protein [Burkholderiales bacterium]
MTIKKILAAAAVAGTALAFVHSAEAQSVGGSFAKGRTHFAVSAGTGYAFDESYLVLGVGASYYLVDGLNAGLALEYWSGSDPKLTKITPSVQYVFYQVQTLKPYVGAFYRRTRIDGLDDLDSVGGRAGVYVPAGRNAFLGLGAVYESYLDCESNVYRKCDSTYAEISLSFAF